MAGQRREQQTHVSLPTTPLGWLAVAFVLAGIALILMYGASFKCLTTKEHKYDTWWPDGIKLERRNCVRCLRTEYRKSETWERINTPHHPFEASGPPTAPIAMPPFPSYRTGTAEIPRTRSGGLASTPTPPQVAGPGHAVLDHE